MADLEVARRKNKQVLLQGSLVLPSCSLRPRILLQGSLVLPSCSLLPRPSRPAPDRSKNQTALINYRVTPASCPAASSLATMMMPKDLVTEILDLLVGPPESVLLHVVEDEAFWVSSPSTVPSASASGMPRSRPTATGSRPTAAASPSATTTSAATSATTAGSSAAGSSAAPSPSGFASGTPSRPSDRAMAITSSGRPRADEEGRRGLRPSSSTSTTTTSSSRGGSTTTTATSRAKRIS
mmetsp:Transcript_38286/g.122770  ORF Transcript_38286/g.122770 Transcript_38286/m.122770 type:complete len:239 (-) Transcript_38286:267-983(-)